MPKTVIGGVVRRRNQLGSLRATVAKIEFPNVAARGNVEVNDVGRMYLKSPPPVIGRYDNKDILEYEDSNHHNESTLRIIGTIGPMVYKVKKTA